jgi:hypothetical protein
MARIGMTDRLHYCYRCNSCGRLITKLEILDARIASRANLCPCGAKTISPTNAKWWEEVFLPRCWKLIFAIYTKRVALALQPLSTQAQAEADRVGRAANREFEKNLSEMIRKKSTV